MFLYTCNMFVCLHKPSLNSVRFKGYTLTARLVGATFNNLLLHLATDIMNENHVKVEKFI